LRHQCRVAHPARVSAEPSYIRIGSCAYSLMIVGRNGGRLEKATLQLKNMTCESISVANGIFGVQGSYSCDVQSWIMECMDNLSEIQFRQLRELRLHIFLVPQPQPGNLLLPPSQKLCCTRTIWQIVKCEDSNDDAGKAFNQKQ